MKRHSGRVVSHNGTADRIREQLSTRLPNPALQAALRIVDIEFRKGAYLFRMPSPVSVGGIYDDLWEYITASASTLGIGKCRRVAKWPTVDELGEVLGAIEWLWPQWLARGFLSLLVGEPGTGKSLMALDLVRCVVSAAPWPLAETHRATRPQTSVWVETESSQQLLHLRTQSMGIDRTHIYLPGFGGDLLGQPDLMDDADQQRLVELVQTQRPDLIVVDSLAGAHTRGENRVEEVRPLLDFLSRLARDYNTSVLGIHHLRKRNPGESMNVVLDRVRGSTAFYAFARLVMALESVPNGGLKLSILKSNISGTPPAISAAITYNDAGDPKGIAYAPYVAPPPKRSKKERCAELIHAYVLESDRANQDVIAYGAEHGYSRNTMYEARELLGDTIEISGTGDAGVWRAMRNPFESQPAI